MSLPPDACPSGISWNVHYRYKSRAASWPGCSDSAPEVDQSGRAASRLSCRRRIFHRNARCALPRNIQTFLPLVRSRRRVRGRDRTLIEPMFPRYLFIALADYRQDWGPIRSTRGVIGLVRLCDEVPIVPEVLIEELQRGQDESGAFDLTGRQQLKVDDPVEVTAGPFAGYQGIFQARTGEQRAIILLEILNRQRRIEIPTHDIKRA